MKLVSFCLSIIYITFAFPEQNASPRIDGRIVGGHEANILDHPYHVEIQYQGSLRCGGAIISRMWILTAAHCVAGLTDSYFTVRVGTSYYGVGGTVLNVSLIQSNANYTSSSIDFDIALIKLTEPIVLSPTAQIIGLADNAAGVVEGSIGNITGWGYTSESGSTSSVLRVAELPVLGHSVCRDLYSSGSVSVTDRMFCAGFWDGGVDACTGDGGGPLVVDSRIIGISSWGIGCARPQRPGVYANVGVLRDWITSITGI